MEHRQPRGDELVIEHPFLDKIYIDSIPFCSGATSKSYYSVCGQYVVKVPCTYQESKAHVSSDNSCWFETFYHRVDDSSPIISHNLKCNPKYRYFESAIIKQAERLNELGPAFNIQSFGLGCLINENLDVLITERYDCPHFSELTVKEMLIHLPAILYALCEYPHGDINPKNILIDDSNHLVRLIDPGMMLVDYNFNLQEVLDYKCIYIANPYYYPLLPPSFFYNRDNIVRDPYSALNLLAVPDPIKPYQKAAGSFPDIADRIAIGIILYEKATGQHPFPQFCKKKPMWEHEYSSSHGGYFFLHAKELQMLHDDSSGIIFNSIFSQYISSLLDNLTPPDKLNTNIGKRESDLILSILQCEKSFEQILDQLLEYKANQISSE